VEAFLVCQQPEALLVFGGAGVEGWLRESEPVELSVKRPMLGGVEWSLRRVDTTGGSWFAAPRISLSMKRSSF